MKRFDEKIVLVIGGSSGIGLASAIAFAREGAQVIVTGRHQATLAVAVDAMGTAGHALRVDIDSQSDLDAMIADIAERFGRVDALFVNAGIGAFIPLECAKADDFDRVMGTNLKGAYFAIQKALPLMDRGSAIVLCGSAGHVKALMGNSIYAASKAGLRSLARSLGLELLAKGIRINCLSPGPVDTPIIEKATDGDADAASAMRQNMAAAVPMGRLGTPQEIARAVLFLASDDASFITGIDLPVDGGLASF